MFQKKLIKVELSPSKKLNFICFNETSVKMMQNTFHFMLKVLLVLEIFTFLSWIFRYVQKQLDKKAKVNFKIYNVKD